MATRKKKPSAASQYESLQQALLSLSDNQIDNDPLVAAQRERIAREQAPNFSGVTATVDSTASAPPAPSEQGWVSNALGAVSDFGGAVVDAVQGGLQRSAASGLYTRADLSDNPTTLLDTLAVGAANYGDTLQNVAGYLTGDRQSTRNLADFGSAIRDPQTQMLKDSERLSKAAEANRSNVDAVRKTLANRGFLVNELGEGVLDAAESPTGALSIIGGPLAGLGMGDQFAQSYKDARDGGLNKEEAARVAELQAYPEAIGFIPAGRLLGKIPGLSKLGQMAENKVNDVLTRTIAQAGATALGEGTGEAVTTAVQLGMHKLNAEFGDSEAVRKYSAGQVPATAGEVGNQLWRSFKAGAVMGGPMGGIEGHFTAAADAGRMAADFNNAMNDAVVESKNAQVNQARLDRAPTPANPEPRQVEMFPTAQSDGRTFAEQEASRQDGYTRQAEEQLARRRIFEQMEAEQNAQADAQREDMFRQMELDRYAAENPQNAIAQQLAGVGGAIPRTRADVALPASDTVAPDVRPVTEPVQGELDVTTPQPIDLARQEVENAVKKQDKAALDKAKSKRAADRRKYREQQLKEVKGDNRVDVIAQRMVDWDRANPVPTAESINQAPVAEAAPVATPAATTPTTVNERAAQYDAVENAPEVTTEESARQEAEAMRQFYPNESEAQLRQRVAQETGRAQPIESMQSRAANFEPGSMADVQKVIGEKIGKSDQANLAALMIGNKKVKLIDSDAARPAGVDERGAAFYDGDGITIDVRRLNKNNITGDMLVLLAHESKHAADYSGAGRAGIESFIGKKANDAINRKIENAAKAGDPIAQRALAAAEDATGGDKSLYEVELPAYFINATRGKAATNMSAALSRQIVSPIRVAAKRMFGINDVNLNDVHYLSDRLVENIATGNESIQANIDQPMPMIYNESSTGFNTAQAEGRTYRSQDGKEKFVLSDADSTMKPNGYQRLREATDPIPLGDLLDHPTLYAQHPGAANIPVIAVDSIPGGAFAQWHGDTGEIYVAKDKMRKVSPRTSIMHEVQHYIQQEGGQQENFFNDAVDPSGYAEQRQTYERALANNDRMSRLVLDRASDLRKAAPDAARFDEVLYDFNKPDWKKAAELISMVDQSKVSPETASTISRYEDSRTQANDLVGTMNETADAKLAAYHRNITEREAFYTQDNVDTPQADLPLNPETEAMRTPRYSPSRPEVEVTDGKIDVPKVLASMQPEDVTLVTPRAGVKGMDNKMWRAIKGSIDYTGGLGKDFDDMLQNSVGQAAHSAMQAQRNMAALDKGIDDFAAKLAKDTNTSVKNATETTKRMIADRMSALEKIQDPVRRENALANFVRDNPELRPLMRAYADITQMSNELADNLAASKVDLTQADKDFIKKIRDSGFGYTTRIYQMHAGKAGRSLARDFLKKVDQAGKKIEQGKTLSEKQADAIGVYTDAATYLMKQIEIPSIETMQGMKQSKLNDLMNTWTNHDVDAWVQNSFDAAKGLGMDDASARAHVKDSMIAQLDAVRDTVTVDNLNAKAAATIRELLGVSGKPGAIAQSVGGLRQDRGILEKRVEMNPAIEKLLGRVTTEPSTVLATTLAKQGELLARTKLLLNLRDSGMVVGKAEANTKGMEQFSYQLSGESAGPLDGMYTTPQVANIVNSTMEMYSSATDAMSASFLNSAAASNKIGQRVMDAVATGAGWAKLSSIVFDGYNLGLNFAGSPFMLAMNGVYNPLTAIRGAKAGVDSVMNILQDGGTKYNALLDDGVKYQVVDSARAQELRSSAHEALRDKIAGSEWAMANTLRHNALKAKRGLVETFSMSDAWVKLAAFQDRVDFLTDFYKAEGINKTQEEIKTEAGNTVRDTNITYGKTPPILRMGERFGITTFMPYFYNVPRMMVKSTVQGVNDVAMGIKATNPKAKQLAITKGLGRLAGNAGAQAALIFGVKAIAQMMNAGSEDDVDEMKKMLRDDSRFADPIYLGKNADGLPLFFRTSRVDPMGPVNDIARVALDDSIDSDEKLDILSKQLKGMVFANRFVAAAVGTALGSEQSKAPMRIERVPVLQDMSGAWKDTVGYGNASRGVLAAVDSLLPGWVDSIDPNNPSVADASDTGQFAQLLATLTKVSGGRVDKGDPSSTLRGIAFEMKEKKDAARAAVADRIRRDADPEETARRIKVANKELYDDMSRMTDVYEGMVNGLGYSPTKAMQVLKEAGSLNSIQIHNVRRGLPKDDPDLVDKVGGVLSKKSIQEAGKRLGRGAGDDTAKDYDKRAAETMRVLRDKYGLKAGE